MKPIELIMEAFGPFAEIEQVSFEKITGVFLITGDTGAGKTTVFDAISFALFGETSGSARQVDSVRSHYADGSRPTRVWLRFSQHNRIYEIERSPRYERPRKSGTGMTTELPKAALKLPDGTILTGKEVVNRKVEELLGLNYKQFKQVAMIAQGEFMQLLLAGSEQRGAVLRKVFHTEDAQRLQIELKNRVSQVRSEAEQRRTELFSILQLIQAPGQDEIAVELREMLEKKDPYRTEALLRGVEAWNREDSTLQTRLSEEDERLTAELSRIERLREQYEHQKELRARYEQQQHKVKEYEARFVSISQRLNRAREQEPVIGQRREELVRLETRMHSRQRADELASQLKELKRQEESLEERWKASGDEVGMLEHTMRNYQQKLEALPELLRQAAQLQLCVQTTRQALEKFIQAQRLEEQCGELTRQLHQQQEKYLKLEWELREAQNEYQRIEELWFRAQAGILAQELRENEPCPVCGSIEHPRVAVLEEAVPDEKIRKQQRQKVEKLQQSRARESAQAAQLQSALEVELGHLRELGVDAACITEARQAYERAREEYEGCQKAISLLEGLKKEQDRTRQRLEELKAQQEALRQSWNRCGTQRSGCEGALRQEEERCGKGSLEELKQAQEQVTAWLRQQEEELRYSQKQYESLDRSLQQEKGSLASLKTSVDQQEEVLQGQEEPEGLLSREGQVRTRKKELALEMRQLSGRLQSNELAVQRLSKAYELYRESGEWYQKLLTLSQTASGELAGRPKLAFEQYIQAFYFEHALKAANRRLIQLSRGQYTLFRRRQAENLRSAEGLELEVLDHYTGRKRPVSSLSGGESFQAALSLALGLSDVIQSFAGGIEVDAVFIDEGFGSLDQQSLQQALETLGALSAGNRLVGVISHVEALKERIPNQLEVIRTIHGSHIQCKTSF